MLTGAKKKGVKLDRFDVVVLLLPFKPVPRDGRYCAMGALAWASIREPWAAWRLR